MTAHQIAQVIKYIHDFDNTIIVETNTDAIKGNYGICFYHYLEKNNANGLLLDSIVDELKALGIPVRGTGGDCIVARKS